MRTGGNMMKKTYEAPMMTFALVMETLCASGDNLISGGDIFGIEEG